MQKAFWNYTEPVEYRAVLVKIRPVTDPPMHWQNAFVGTERQALEITAKDGSKFYIDNEDGLGLLKLNARGGPDSSHRSIDQNNFFASSVPDEEIKTFSLPDFKETEAKIDAWQKEKDPEQYERMLGLKKLIADSQAKYPRK